MKAPQTIFSIVGGIIAGILSNWLFAQLWPRFENLPTLKALLVFAVGLVVAALLLWLSTKASLGRRAVWTSSIIILLTGILLWWSTNPPLSSSNVVTGISNPFSEAGKPSPELSAAVVELMTSSLLLKTSDKVTHPVARAIRYGYLRGSVIALMLVKKHMGDDWVRPYWQAVEGDVAALGWPAETGFRRDAFARSPNDEQALAACNRGTPERYRELSKYLSDRNSAFAQRQDCALFLGMIASSARLKLFEQSAGLQSSFTENRESLADLFYMMSRLTQDLGLVAAQRGIDDLLKDIRVCTIAADYKPVSARFDGWGGHLIDAAGGTTIFAEGQ